VAPGHPLARAAEVRWRDLADLAWVLREPGSGTRSEFEQAALRGGLDPAGLHALLELPSNESVLAAAASGGLVAAVSELAAQPMIAAGRIHRLPLAVATRTFELLTHTQRSRTRAAAAFIALLKSRPDAMS
jgi:DNA-binding transcriptional LysR family regulator